MLGRALIGKLTFVAITSSSRRAIARSAAGDFFADAERVHVRGVEEIDAGVDRAFEERLRGGFVEYPWPPARIAVTHAPERKPRNRQSTRAEPDVFHTASNKVEIIISFLSVRSHKVRDRTDTMDREPGVQRGSFARSRRPLA